MELFRLFGTILVDNNKANKSIEETTTKAEKSSGKVGSAIKTIGKIGAVAATAFATAVGTLTKKAVENYAEYEQLVGGVETLFQSSSKKVLDYANSAYKTAGMSANKYMETVTGFSASLLQSLGGDTEKAAEIADMAIIDMSDNANKMGTSIESIQNAYQGFAKQNYTMLDNLKLGYGGTKAEMERLLTDAGKLTGMKYDITNLNDVYQAIHVIQTELGITGTTAKEASTTIQGAFGSMKSAWSNLLTGMSDPNQDMSVLVSNMSDSIITVFENLAPRIITTIPRVIQGMGELITQLVTYGQNGASEYMNKFGDKIKEKIPELLSKGLEMLSNFSQFIVENVPLLVQNGADIVGNIIKGIIDSLPTLIEKAPEIITNFANTISASATIIASKGIELILYLIKGIIESIPTLIANIPKIIEAILAVWNAINWLNLGSTLVDGIKSGITKMGGSLKETASTLFNQLKENIGNIFTRIKEIITSPIFSAKTKVLALVGELQTAAINVFKSLLAKAKNIFHNVKTAMTTPIETAKNTIKGIVDTIKGFFSGLKISFPKIPLPHFSIKPKGWDIGDLLKGSIPTLGIDWYAKGGILTKPTAFGINSNGNLQVGGEAGKEAVAPIETLLEYVRTAVNESNDGMYEALKNIILILSEYLPQLSNMKIVLDNGVLVGELIDDIDDGLGDKKRRKGR